MDEAIRRWRRSRDGAGVNRDAEEMEEEEEERAEEGKDDKRSMIQIRSVRGRHSRVVGRQRVG